ncbi:IclR family transcriptional regulator [Actinoallomurus sp. NBC_01490]|uniref:IclR family transcriptional regulator n=1 Tax=Actinoallomurus sp. NBC_01490 TaxID=2903557 RepID=UPI002E3403EF|nr:IclR family transcriptional regulator [Actinoallomurus sp. NBC_01490]
MTQDEPKSVQARNLVRAFALLDILADNAEGRGAEGRTLAELAEAAALPEATTHRLLSVLADLNVVRAGDAGRWRIGRHCLELGAAYLESVEIRAEARDLMKRLTADTGETCALGVLDEDRVVYVEKIDSPHPVRMHSGIGRSNPAVTSALGRAILAWSPESVVERVLKNGLRRRTDNTITSVEEFLEELVRCRERGFSIDDVENEPGIRGVGAPVMDYRGWPVAALSVAGPEHRVGRDGLADLGRATAEAARELSSRLGYSPRVASARS